MGAGLGMGESYVAIVFLDSPPHRSFFLPDGDFVVLMENPVDHVIFVLPDLPDRRCLWAHQLLLKYCFGLEDGTNPLLF